MIKNLLIIFFSVILIYSCLEISKTDEAGETEETDETVTITETENISDANRVKGGSFSVEDIPNLEEETLAIPSAYNSETNESFFKKNSEGDDGFFKLLKLPRDFIGISEEMGKRQIQKILDNFSDTSTTIPKKRCNIEIQWYNQLFRR